MKVIWEWSVLRLEAEKGVTAPPCNCITPWHHRRPSKRILRREAWPDWGKVLCNSASSISVAKRHFSSSAECLKSWAGHYVQSFTHFSATMLFFQSYLLLPLVSPSSPLLRDFRSPHFWGRLHPVLLQCLQICFMGSECQPHLPGPGILPAGHLACHLAICFLFAPSALCPLSLFFCLLDSLNI